MSYTWSHPIESADLPRQGAAPLELQLSVHNSLSSRGFVWFFAITGVLMCIPLMAVFGTSLWWGILAYLLLTLGGAWVAIQRSWTRGTVTEVLHVWRDHLHLIRTNPDGTVQNWEANPYWVRVVKHDTDGPVPHYVTLCGAGRDVEIGSFLAEDERKSLAQDLNILLRRLRGLSQAAP